MTLFSLTVASFLTALHLANIFYSIDATPTTFTNDNIQACGRELADVLQRVCKLGYNSYYTNEQAESALAGKQTRRKRGITRECCLQPCSWSNLHAYCSFDPSVAVKSDISGGTAEGSVKRLVEIIGGANKHPAIQSNVLVESSASGCANKTFASSSSSSSSTVSNDKNNEIRLSKPSDKPCSTRRNNENQNENEILKPYPNLSSILRIQQNNTHKFPFKNHDLMNRTYSKDSITWQVKIKELYFEKEPLMVNIPVEPGNTSRQK